MSIVPRRLTNDELLQQAARRAELTKDYTGEISDADLAIADPAVVDYWLEAGRFTALGIAPRRTR